MIGILILTLVPACRGQVSISVSRGKNFLVTSP
jgi:hypothetical protein